MKIYIYICMDICKKIGSTICEYSSKLMPIFFLTLPAYGVYSFGSCIKEDFFKLPF
jgi:hypothetical protein